MVNVSLTGKTVIVTGGGRGLGRAMAFGLAREGANVCIAAHIQDDILSVEEGSVIINFTIKESVEKTVKYLDNNRWVFRKRK